MAYQSIFDRILELDPEFKCGYDPLFVDGRAYNYIGRLGDVLNELLTITASGASTERELLTLARHPTRIIRGLVDTKISLPSEELEGLLRESIDVALGIYRNSDGIVDRVSELKSRIEATKLHQYIPFSGMRIEEKSDWQGWLSCHPKKSSSSARQLFDEGYNDVLFIALAHGGTAPGMDVYLRYCDLSGSDNSVLYVARFSRRKHHDPQPELSPKEIAYLQRESQGRQIVIFEEDRATGKTSLRARDFFSELFPDMVVRMLTNYSETYAVPV